MSDFDKEAEREKLREQFAEDEADRENTERMSELLLKGATMTNKHCDQCGDPIFRYRGQAFCPTCSAQAGAADVDDQLAAAADPDAAGQGGQSEAGQPDAPQQPAPQQPDATSQRPGEVSGAPAQHTPEPSGDVPANGATAEAADGTDAVADTGASAVENVEGRAPDRPTSQVPASTAADAGGDAAMTDLGPARASLSRTVTRFAAAAEDADDLARAREYLAAVEDAAVALRAVRDAER